MGLKSCTARTERAIFAFWYGNYVFPAWFALRVAVGGNSSNEFAFVLIKKVKVFGSVLEACEFDWIWLNFEARCVGWFWIMVLMNMQHWLLKWLGIEILKYTSPTESRQSSRREIWNENFRNVYKKNHLSLWIWSIWKKNPNYWMYRYLNDVFYFFFGFTLNYNFFQFSLQNSESKSCVSRQTSSSTKILTVSQIFEFFHFFIFLNDFFIFENFTFFWICLVIFDDLKFEIFNFSSFNFPNFWIFVKKF